MTFIYWLLMIIMYFFFVLKLSLVLFFFAINSLKSKPNCSARFCLFFIHTIILFNCLKWHLRLVIPIYNKNNKNIFSFSFQVITIYVGVYFFFSLSLYSTIKWWQILKVAKIIIFITIIIIINNIIYKICKHTNNLFL